MKTFAILVACAAMLSAAVSVPKSAFGTGSIAGTITDSVTGYPIAGAKVTVGGCGRAATTGDDGTYTIANLAPGSYTVTAMKCHAYYAKSYPTPVRVEEGQAVTGIDIALRPMGGGGGSGSISGTVVDAATNEPIAGAKVTAGSCGRSAMTGDDGTYTIANLADGSYTVKAMKSGYHCATYPTPVVIENGQPVTGIDFSLQPRSLQALD
jgi:uncharacterized protein (DUF2141 family)